jgi:hypothetical protein
MKITIAAIIAATIIASPASAAAKTATCLDWIRLIATVTKEDVKIVGAFADVAALGAPLDAGLAKLAAQKAEHLADAANNALVQAVSSPRSAWLSSTR